MFKYISLQSLTNFRPREGVDFEFQIFEGIQKLENNLTRPAHQSEAQINFNRVPQSLVPQMLASEPITHW
jgi:hypothetical protein